MLLLITSTFWIESIIMQPSWEAKMFFICVGSSTGSTSGLNILFLIFYFFRILYIVLKGK